MTIEEIKANAPPKASHYCIINNQIIYAVYKNGAWRDMQGNEIKQAVMKPINF
mgnify:FL=1